MSKRSFNFQSIEQKLADFLQPIFSGSKKEFILINNLVKNWQEIVGKKYYQFCYPKSVNLNKDKNSKTILTIAVYNSAVGFFLENNSDLIIERIAGFYGFKAIAKIIIKQEPKVVNHIDNSEIKLSSFQESFLQEKTAKILDNDLAITIKKLGCEIFKNKL
ncbi:MAG: DUF721 domain-containing protein [Rickettsiales bacterium]|nr:DUF721 domain-containing protein [Rickettsiales bacterium]